MGIDRCCWSIAPVCYSWRRYWKGCERWKAIKSPWVPRPSGSADFRPGVDSDRAGWFGLDHRTARTADHSTSNQTRSLSARMNLCDQLWRRRRKGGGEGWEELGVGRIGTNDPWPHLLRYDRPPWRFHLLKHRFSFFLLLRCLYIFIFIYIFFYVSGLFYVSLAFFTPSSTPSPIFSCSFNKPDWISLISSRFFFNYNFRFFFAVAVVVVVVVVVVVSVSLGCWWWNRKGWIIQPGFFGCPQSHFYFQKMNKKNWWLCIGGEAEEEEKGKEEEEEEEILLRCLTTSVDTFRSPLLSHFIEEGLIFTFVWNFSGIFWKNVVAVAVVAFFHAANIHWMRLHDDYIN